MSTDTLTLDASNFDHKVLQQDGAVLDAIAADNKGRAIVGMVDVEAHMEREKRIIAWFHILWNIKIFHALKLYP